MTNSAVTESACVYSTTSFVLSNGVYLGAPYAFLAVAILSILARIVSRLKNFQRLFTDDYLIIIAGLFLITEGICHGISANALLSAQREGVAGEQVHTQSNPDPMVPWIMKIGMTIAYLFFICLWTVKASFLMFFRRLGKDVQYYEILWWSVAIVCFLTFIGCMVSMPLYVSFKYPSAGQSTQSIHQGLFVLRFGAGADVSTDILIAFLPVSLLWRVKLPIRRKLMLSCLLCGSLVTVIVAFLRIEVTSKMSYLPNPVWLNFWSGIEGAVAISTCCFASLRALFPDDNHYNSPSPPSPPFIYTSTEALGQQPSPGFVESKSPPASSNTSQHGTSTKREDDSITNAKERTSCDRDEELFKGYGLLNA